MSNPIYVSPSIASKLIGISERSIRRAIKKHELPIVVKHSRYNINIHDLLLWSGSLPNRARKRDELGIGQYVEKWKI